MRSGEVRVEGEGRGRGKGERRIEGRGRATPKRVVFRPSSRAFRPENPKHGSEDARGFWWISKGAGVVCARGGGYGVVGEAAAVLAPRRTTGRKCRFNCGQYRRRMGPRFTERVCPVFDVCPRFG